MFYLIIILQFVCISSVPIQFRVTHEWKYLNFTWPSTETLQLALANGFYIPGNVVISGVDYHNGYFYLSLPRMRLGTPATLARISSNSSTTNPLLEPYPSWGYNQISNCSALQNVQNLEVDTNSTLWILDGGHVNTLSSNPIRLCPPKLILYDTRLNRTLQTHIFPEEVVGNNSFLYDLVLDDNYAYITDNSAIDPGIIVYNLNKDKSWKVRDDTMRAQSTAQQLRINRVLINAPINIAGIALSPKSNTTRLVYYSPISSRHLYAVPARVLQNMFYKSDDLVMVDEFRDVGVKTSQTDGMLMDNKGILYYGLLGENSIGRWDSKKPFTTSQKVIARDSTYIQWTNAFTLDRKGNLIVLTDRLQMFITTQLNLNEANFWLLSAHVGGGAYTYPQEVITTTTESTSETILFVTEPNTTPYTSSGEEINQQLEVTTTQVSKETNAADTVSGPFLTLTIILTYANGF